MDILRFSPAVGGGEREDAVAAGAAAAAETPYSSSSPSPSSSKSASPSPSESPLTTLAPSLPAMTRLPLFLTTFISLLMLFMMLCVSPFPLTPPVFLPLSTCPALVDPPADALASKIVSFGLKFDMAVRNSPLAT